MYSCPMDRGAWHVRLFVTPRTVAHQAPLSMGILQARIVQWLAYPPPGYLPNPGFKPRSPALQADSLLSEPSGKPKNAQKSFPYHLPYLNLDPHSLHQALLSYYCILFIALILSDMILFIYLITCLSLISSSLFE